MNKMIGLVEGMKGQEGAQGNKLQIKWRLCTEIQHRENTTPWQRPRGKQGDTGDNDREDRRGGIGVGMDMTHKEPTIYYVLVVVVASIVKSPFIKALM